MRYPNQAMGAAANRGASIMSLIQSARVDGHDSSAYWKDALTRLL